MRMAWSGSATVTSVMATLIVLLAQPAQAKCVSAQRVVIRGAASTNDLEMTRKQWAARSSASPTAVVIEGMLGRFPKDPSPPRRLGPRYQVLYFLEVLDFRTNTTSVQLLEQHLYPQTSAGPMTFTPRQTADISCIGRSVQISPGWQPFPKALLDKVKRLGLPPPAWPPPGQPELTHGAVVVTALAAGLLLIGGVLGARARRSRRGVTA